MYFTWKLILCEDGSTSFIHGLPFIGTVCFPDVKILLPFLRQRLLPSDHVRTAAFVFVTVFFTFLFPFFFCSPFSFPPLSFPSLPFPIFFSYSLLALCSIQVIWHITFCFSFRLISIVFPNCKKVSSVFPNRHQDFNISFSSTHFIYWLAVHARYPSKKTLINIGSADLDHYQF